MPRKSQSRFRIRGIEETLDYRKAETPGAVLSKTLDLALESDDPGVWDVLEWDDVIYRVHRLDGPKLDVRVEVVRP